MSPILCYFNLAFLFICVKSQYFDKSSDSSEEKIMSFQGSESNEIRNYSSKETPQRINAFIKLQDDEYNVGCSNVSSGKEYKTHNKNCKRTAYYPYVVSVQRKGSHYASGALVDRRWILSSGQEFYNVRETIKLFRARLGSVNCKSGGNLYPLQEVAVHPLFSFGKPNYDVALIRLASPIRFSDFIKPITLSKIRAWVVSAMFKTMYWARLIVKGRLLPKTAKERIKPYSLRVSTQKMIPWDKCFQQLENINVTLDMSNICLNPVTTHHTPCTPDAGAPVVANDGLWGITSGWTSEDCLKKNTPTLFTRLSSPPVRSWLEKIVDNI